VGLNHQERGFYTDTRDKDYLLRARYHFAEFELKQKVNVAAGCGSGALQWLWYGPAKLSCPPYRTRKKILVNDGIKKDGNSILCKRATATTTATTAPPTSTEAAISRI
jgi:hypothetical protein